jgi:hypothetical protein
MTLLVPEGWSKSFCYKLNSGNVARILLWSHYFSKYVVSQISLCSVMSLLSLGILWEYSIENLHTNSPHILEELKQNNETYISEITYATLHCVASNMQKRLNVCINKDADHFQLML